MIYLLNNKIENLYMPDYFYNYLMNKNFDKLNIHIIKLPNYIKVGEWGNTIEQQQYMIKYNYNNYIYYIIIFIIILIISFYLYY